MRRSRMSARPQAASGRRGRTPARQAPPRPPRGRTRILRSRPPPRRRRTEPRGTATGDRRRGAQSGMSVRVEPLVFLPCCGACAGLPRCCESRSLPAAPRSRPDKWHVLVKVRNRGREQACERPLQPMSRMSVCVEPLVFLPCCGACAGLPRCCESRNLPAAPRSRPDKWHVLVKVRNRGREQVCGRPPRPMSRAPGFW